MNRPAFIIAVVDPNADWGEMTASVLQSEVRGFPCMFFDSVAAWYQFIDNWPLMVPIVQIADSAARMPSPAKGVFARITEIVPRCKHILYTTHADSPENGMLTMYASYRSISRLEEDHRDKLIRLVKSSVMPVAPGTRAMDSIMLFYETAHLDGSLDVSSVGGDEKLRYAPRTMLTEMLRATERGKMIIDSMVPKQLLQFPEPH